MQLCGLASAALQSSQFVAVLLRERDEADLVDRAQIACRKSQGHVAPEFGNPETATLNVHLLPARGLDVGVRNAPSAHLALTCDLTLGHGAAEAS